jgi:hypothetical protein
MFGAPRKGRRGGLAEQVKPVTFEPSDYEKPAFDAIGDA